MATKEESSAALHGWIGTLRVDLKRIEGFLNIIDNNWSFEAIEGQVVTMDDAEKQTMLQNGLAVLVHLQTTAATLPDVSGLIP